MRQQFPLKGRTHPPHYTVLHPQRNKFFFQGIFNAVKTSDIKREVDVKGWRKLHNGDRVDLSVQFQTKAT
jgi:hypothetical protein